MGRQGILLWAAGALWAVGVAVGVVAESVAFGWYDPLHWLPDLAVGWTFIGCGLLAASRWPGNNSGLLMTTTGFTWFLGNFAAVDNQVLAWLGANAIFVHRGPLVHLILAYPVGHLPGRLERAAVGAGYGAAFVAQIWRNDAATIFLAALLLAVSARGYLRAVDRASRARLLSLRASAGLSSVLIAVAVASLSAGTAAGRPALFAYQVALVAIGGGIFAGLLSASWDRADVVDLVVELGEHRSGTLRGELSRALGDPSLDVGYWVADADAFVDADGRAFSLPAVDSERSVTFVRRRDETVAAIVHDPSVLGDPGLADAVASAAVLAAANAGLQAELQRRIAELVASRRRILEAADEERQHLERRLRDGAERRLEGLAGILFRGARSASGNATKEKILRAREQLDRTLEDMRGLAMGLHPRVLSERGLGGALAIVAADLPIPVSVEASPDRLPTGVEAVAYFICSEALTNVAKHASASTVRVTVEVDEGWVTVVVEDDGRGGADPLQGSGLRGLADRVQALGGTLRVESSSGHGTRLAAEIPLAVNTP
jgi:signal transduction histidine kinase